MRSQSFVRDTALVTFLVVCGIVGVGFLVASVRGESAAALLGALFTDISWLFTCLVLLLVWWAMYPRLSAEPDE